jgi:hypothetical protein
MTEIEKKQTPSWRVVHLCVARFLIEAVTNRDAEFPEPMV